MKHAKHKMTKAGKVMAEYYRGTLKSGSGHAVVKPSQAKAIAMSEQRRAAAKRRR